MKTDSTGTEMSPVVEGLLMIHKIISKGLHTSISKCNEYIGKSGIPPGEVTGFSRYLSTLKGVTHSHHLSEDDIVFPRLKEIMDAPYDRLKDDHDRMAHIIEAFDQSILEVSSGRIGNLGEVLGELDKLWGPHIKIEEENFTSAKLNALMTMKEQTALVEKLREHGLKNTGPGPLVLPFFIYTLEGKEKEDLLKSLPWFVRKVLVPVIWKGQWKPMMPFLA